MHCSGEKNRKICQLLLLQQLSEDETIYVLSFYYQCCRSISFWSGSGSADPFREIVDPAPIRDSNISALFFSIKNITLKTTTFFVIYKLLFIHIQHIFYVLPGFIPDPFHGFMKWIQMKWIWVNSDPQHC